MQTQGLNAGFAALETAALSDWQLHQPSSICTCSNQGQDFSEGQELAVV